MSRFLTTNDIEGMTHLIILQSDTEIKFVKFEGPQAHINAQKRINELMGRFDGIITLAVEISQCYPAKYISKAR